MLLLYCWVGLELSVLPLAEFPLWLSLAEVSVVEGYHSTQILGQWPVMGAHRPPMSRRANGRFGRGEDAPVFTLTVSKVAAEVSVVVAVTDSVSLLRAGSLTGGYNRGVRNPALPVGESSGTMVRGPMRYTCMATTGSQQTPTKINKQQTAIDHSLTAASQTGA